MIRRNTVNSPKTTLHHNFSDKSTDYTDNHTKGFFLQFTFVQSAHVALLTKIHIYRIFFTE